MKPPLKMLIEKYRNNLYTAAFNVCKNAQDAEDVVQDTFLQYWSQKKEFETEQHIRAWLLRVAINKAKNKNNTFFRRNALPLEDYMETLAFQSEESSELFEAVMKLPGVLSTAMAMGFTPIMNLPPQPWTASPISAADSMRP